MSTSRSHASRIWLIVAAWPLINARERPFASTTRRNSSRFGSPSSACARSHSPIPGSESMANSAVTSARSAPERTCSLPARSPSVNDRASIRIDFPAPVSPVRAVKPGRNSSSRRSTIAKSRIDRCWSIRQLEHCAPVQLLPQHREVAVTRRVDELDGMLRAPDKDVVALLKVALQLPIEMKPRIDRALQGDLDHGAVEISLKRSIDARLHFDGQLQCDLQEGDHVLIRRAEHTVKFVHPPGYSYFAMLRQKLHWSAVL